MPLQKLLTLGQEMQKEAKARIKINKLLEQAGSNDSQMAADGLQSKIGFPLSSQCSGTEDNMLSMTGEDVRFCIKLYI